MKQITCILLLFFAAGSARAAEKVTIESGDTPATLVELFTSEGCSSCPPADVWISNLKSSADLWKRVVPVVWHVDYWDRLGWRDRFAQRDFTARQHRYAEEWASGSVYTPEFVRNGREWKGWYESVRVPAASSGGSGKLQVSFDDPGKAFVSFKPATQGDQPLQIHLALLGTDLVSNVARGENSGRKLRHNFVVLAYTSAAMKRKGDSYSADVTLASSQPDKPSAIAAWVTAADSQPPIQVAGGWLQR